MYQKYHWESLQDLPEPTDAELAEVDEAIAQVGMKPGDALDPDMVEAWANSYQVKKALEAVGEPDGSADWILDFTGHLLAITDAIEEKVDGATRDRLCELAFTWRNQRGRQGNMRSTRQGIVGELLEHMTLSDAAWYLSVDVETLTRMLWPASSPAALRAAATAYVDGVGLMRAAKDAGIGHRTLASYLKRSRIHQPHHVTVDGRWMMRPAEREMVVALATEGWGAASILRHMKAAFPESGVGFHGIKHVVGQVRIAEKAQAA